MISIAKVSVLSINITGENYSTMPVSGVNGCVLSGCGGCDIGVMGGGFLTSHAIPRNSLTSPTIDTVCYILLNNAMYCVFMYEVHTILHCNFV